MISCVDDCEALFFIKRYIQYVCVHSLSTVMVQIDFDYRFEYDDLQLLSLAAFVLGSIHYKLTFYASQQRSLKVEILQITLFQLELHV